MQTVSGGTCVSTHGFQINHKKPVLEKSFNSVFQVNFGNKSSSLATISHAISMITSPIFILIEYVCTQIEGSFHNEKLDGGCDNLFSHKFFKHVRSENARIIAATLEENSTLLNLLESDCSDDSAVITFKKFVKRGLKTTLIYRTPKQNRSWYKENTKLFRMLSDEVEKSTSQHSEELEIFLKAYSAQRFRSVSLIEKTEQFLPKTSQVGVFALEEMYDTLSQDVELRSAGVKNIGFDAISYGNVPFKLPSIKLRHIDGVCRDVVVIRMPSVTSDQEQNEDIAPISFAKITSEFMWYLRGLKDLNETHLYVNNMFLGGPNENVRSKAIQKLSEDEEISLKVITLDKNSHFYRQDGSEYGAESMKGSECIEHYMNNLTNVNSNYYFPKEYTREVLSQIINRSAMELFGDGFKNIELSRELRKIFIDFTYCKLIEDALARLNIHSLNASCKNCIDRGPTTLYSLYKYSTSKFGGRANYEGNLSPVVLAPAILVSNRPPQIYHFNRCAEFTRFLEEEGAT